MQNEADEWPEAYLLQNFLILFRKSAGSNHDIQSETPAFFIVTRFDRIETRIQSTLVFESSLEEPSDAFYISVEIPILHRR